MSAPGSFRSGSSLAYALSVTNASVAATLPVGFVGGGGVARVSNSGASNVFVVFGVGVQTAVLPATGAPPVGQAGFMCLKGNTTYVDIPANCDSFAAIGDAAGPSVIYVHRGEGNGP